MKLYEYDDYSTLEVRVEEAVCSLISNNHQTEVVFKIDKNQISKLVNYLQIADGILEEEKEK